MTAPWWNISSLPSWLIGERVTVCNRHIIHTLSVRKPGAFACRYRWREGVISIIVAIEEHLRGTL